MYCHNCGKEINDTAQFCGYCGSTVKKVPIATENSALKASEENVQQPQEEASIPTSPAADALSKTNTEQNEPAPAAEPAPVVEPAPAAEPAPAENAAFAASQQTSTAPAQEQATQTGETSVEQKAQGKKKKEKSPKAPKPPKEAKKKKKIWPKILLVFIIIALIGGGVLGYLTAKGIIDWKQLLPTNKFEWTQYVDTEDTEQDTVTTDTEDASKETEQVTDEVTDEVTGEVTGDVTGEVTGEVSGSDTQTDTDTSRPTDTSGGFESTSADTYSGDETTSGTSADNGGTVAVSDYLTIKNNGTLRVGFSELAKYSYIDRNTSELKGFDIELAAEVARRLELDVEYIKMDFNDLIPELQSNEIDCIWSAITPTVQRDEYVDFTNVYVTDVSDGSAVQYAAAFREGSDAAAQINAVLATLKNEGFIRSLAQEYGISIQ